MRSIALLVVLSVFSSSLLAYAQPAPAPVPAPEVAEPQPTEGSSFQLRAGIGFGRYTESGPGWKWASELQPYAIVGADGAFPSGRGHLVLQAQAGFGSDAHMTGSGQLMQENDFHQQILEVSPRYRHPMNPRLYFEAGYKLTIQKLTFTNIPGFGTAVETVTVHAIEGGVGWKKVALDGSRKHVSLMIGVNRGSAENDRVEGEDFSAGGTSLDARVGKRWASGFGLDAQVHYRKQSGSDVGNVTVDGMAAQAMWPKNVTWQMLAVIGFAL